jgi:hypothetical protein
MLSDWTLSLQKYQTQNQLELDEFVTLLKTNFGSPRMAFDYFLNNYDATEKNIISKECFVVGIRRLLSH